MMSYQDPSQSKLFYMGINIDKRIRKNHPLRKIRELIDFDFIYNEVKDKYGYNGNESIPPPIILKLILLVVLYNVRSERELMDTLGERLDWLWFLGFDLDTEIPNHSVLSKARRRWGEEAFKSFYERVVWQCVESGLVDGRKVFVDSSLIQADASNNSVVDTQSLRRYLSSSYKELEKRLEEEASEGEVDRGGDDDKGRGGVNKRYISTTDPDASIMRSGGKPKLMYRAHRAVDPAYEIITATDMTGAEVNEAHKMIGLIESHHNNTEIGVETVVADSKYGTIENYLRCYDIGVRAHIPDLKEAQSKGGLRKGIFSDEMFSYDSEADMYTCPAGKKLRPKSVHMNRQSMDYGASKRDCSVCNLRPLCTRNKTGRTVKRHLRQEEVDHMRELANTTLSKNDIRTRQHLMERSFARSVRYGSGRARWRRLWRVRIQEYLTAAIQNIQILMKYGTDPRKAVAVTRVVGEFREKLRGMIKSFKIFLLDSFSLWRLIVKPSFV
ncbi:IS1182 family transposase [Desulfobacterota bacterium AH_259_B03_O07]|nr:IS1182 family transposase [Desulfobacterota bacterium AH_259_B03_O07]